VRGMPEAGPPEEIRNEPASGVVQDMMEDTQRALESCPDTNRTGQQTDV
jgi:hypothetical protein